MTTTGLSYSHEVSNDFTINMTIPETVLDISIGVKWPLLPIKISFASFGLICNSLIFIGLTECRKRVRTLDKLLLNIAIWDTVFLSARIGQQITQALLAICSDRLACGKMYFVHQLFNYIAKTSFVTSMLSTVSVAVERYLYSFKPITVASYSNRTRTRLVISAIFCISLVVSIPEIITITCVYHVYIDRLAVAISWPVCRTATFNYVVQTGLLLRLTVKILAWVTLLILDSVLVSRLLAGARRARRMYDEDGGRLHQPRCYNEKSLTVAVMTLVAMSLVAYPITGFTWVFTYASAGWSGVLDPRTIPDIQEVGKVVQLIYTSSNLFFLLMFGKRFRQKLLSRLSYCRCDFSGGWWCQWNTYFSLQVLGVGQMWTLMTPQSSITLDLFYQVCVCYTTILLPSVSVDHIHYSQLYLPTNIILYCIFPTYIIFYFSCLHALLSILVAYTLFSILVAYTHYSLF